MNEIYKCRQCGHVMSKVIKLEEWITNTNVKVTYEYVCTPCSDTVLIKLNGMKKFK